MADPREDVFAHDMNGAGDQVLVGDEDTDDFEKTLSEFDDAATDTPYEAPRRPQFDFNEARAAVAELQRQVEVDQEAVVRQRDQHDFDRLLETIHREYPDLGALGSDTLRQLLIGRGLEDSKLDFDWVHRYERPQEWRHTLGRLLTDLRRIANNRPDTEATSARAIVADAVRRGGSGTPPPEAPKNYGNLSDREFAQEIRETYGFEVFKNLAP